MKTIEEVLKCLKSDCKGCERENYASCNVNDYVIELLEELAKDHNEPLTLDELKAMDGEMVWCVNGIGQANYCLVEKEFNHCIDNYSGAWEFMYYDMRNYENKDKLHGNGWVGYKLKKTVIKRKEVQN